MQIVAIRMPLIIPLVNMPMIRLMVAAMEVMRTSTRE